MLCRGHAQYPAFARNTLLSLRALQKRHLGFWSFCIFLSRICSNCACTHLFLVPYSFFVFCCSRCKHCSKGSQVPACLSLNFFSENRENRGESGHTYCDPGPGEHVCRMLVSRVGQQERRGQASCCPLIWSAPHSWDTDSGDWEIQAGSHCL